jgi:type IV secretory pathway TraG/TraD family ATPase VirD4
MKRNWKEEHGGYLRNEHGIVLGQDMSAQLKITDNACTIVRQKRGGMIYRAGGNGSVLVIGPDRSGKLVGNVIPTIFDYRGSILSIGYYNCEYKSTFIFRNKISTVYNYEIKNTENGNDLICDLEGIDFFNGNKPVTVYVSTAKSNIGKIKTELQKAIKKILKGRKNMFGEMKHSLLIIIDDFLELGISNLLKKYIPLLAGRNIHFLVISQSLRQLSLEIKDSNRFLELFNHIVFYSPAVVDEEDYCHLKHLKNFNKTSEGEEFVSDFRKLSWENIVIMTAWNNHPPIIGKKVIYYDDKRYNIKAGCL